MDENVKVIKNFKKHSCHKMWLTDMTQSLEN